MSLCCVSLCLAVCVRLSVVRFSVCVSSPAKRNMRERVYRETAQRARFVAIPDRAAHRRPRPTAADHSQQQPTTQPPDRLGEGDLL